MDKTIVHYDTIEAMHTASVQAWRRISGEEKLRAVTEITRELYALKGDAPEVCRLQRTLVRIQRPPG